MKKTFLKSLAGIAAVAFAVSCTAPAPKYKTVVVDAPFAMEPIKECVFPEQDFSIVDYGAVKGGETVNTEAIAKAIAACNKAGGGRVVIPEGEIGRASCRERVCLYV